MLAITDLQAYVKYLNMVSTSKERFPDVYNNLGIVLGHLGKHGEALTSLNKAVEMNPNYVDALVNRAFSLAQNGQVDEGFRSFKELHNRNPNDINTVLFLGVFCMRQKWHEIGLEQLSRAAELKPDIPYVLAWHAAGTLEAGDYKAAEGLFKRAQAVYARSGLKDMTDSADDAFPDKDIYRRWRNPHLDITLHLFMGSFFAHEKEIDKAEGEFLYVYNKFPGYTDAMVGLAAVAKERNLTGKTEKWLSKAIEIDTDAHVANIDLGKLHMGRSEFDHAIKEFRTAVVLRPMFPDYRYHLGSLLLKMGEIDLAISEFRRALSISPGYGLASLEFAKACIAKGNTDEAITVLMSSSCSDWPEAREIIAKVRR